MADDYAFAGCKPIGFDNDGRMEHLKGFFDLGLGGADGVVGGGNVVALEEELGEAFAGFKHGSGARGPKDAEATLPQRVDDAERQGSSGPTMVRSGCSTSTRRTIASTSLRLTGRQRATCAMPPLPGAQTICEARGLRAIAQARACSRPPEPRIKTFMTANLSSGASTAEGSAARSPKGYGRQLGWGKSNGVGDEMKPTRSERRMSRVCSAV